MSTPHDDAPVFPLPRPRAVMRLDQWHPTASRSVRLTLPFTVHGAPPDLCALTLATEVHAADANTAQIVVHPTRHRDVEGPLGYALVAFEKPRPQVGIWADDLQGVRAALQTLRQMLRAFGPAVPPIEIIDWPAFPTRGVMLDVSRCRIPTMPEFGRIIPLLASLKFNHLQLYTEHTFAYRDHPEVWTGWDPITADETRELSTLCTLHGITLAPNQNTFGHMKHWLDHPRYAGLAETHDDFDFYGMTRRGPFSLCPTDPAARALACSLLDELVPNFNPDAEGRTLVNIGCDETADAGAGRSRADVARLGKPTVYAHHVAAVMRHCLSRGWTPQFWADIALEHPSLLDLLPREAIPLAWGYEPDSPFEKWGSTLAASGREWWVCPGTSSWRSITGRTTERKANIESAARAGVAHGASGFMVCDWGDVGHMQQWPITLNALAHAADAAWTGGESGYDPRAASLHALADHSLALGPWLDQLGDADLPIRQAARHGDPGRRIPPLVNASALFTALWPARLEFERPDALATPLAWREVEARLQALQARLPLLDGQRASLFRDELEFTCRLATLAARRGSAQADPGALRAEVRRCQAEFGRLWSPRSRPGGLAKAAGFWDELHAHLGRAE